MSVGRDLSVWTVRAARFGGSIELYVAGDARGVHHVGVELSMLLHPSVRRWTPRNDEWWGAVAAAAARVVESHLRAVGTPVPPVVVVRRLGHLAAPVALPDGAVVPIHRFLL